MHQVRARRQSPGRRTGGYSVEIQDGTALLALGYQGVPWIEM